MTGARSACSATNALRLRRRRGRVQPRVLGDPGGAQAEGDRRDRRLVRPVHPARRAGHIRSDNGPEFIARAVQDWITAVGAKTAYIAPGSPWENGYVESFNARRRDEVLDGEIFYSLREAQVIVENWRDYYNTARPHGSIGYKPPAPEVRISDFDAGLAAQPRPAPPALLTVAPRPTMN